MNRRSEMYPKKLDQIWESPGPGGLLSPDTIDDIDSAAGALVEAVHCGGTADVDRIMRGMTWTHLAALALSVATLVEPVSTAAKDGLAQTVFTVEHLRALHAAYERGERDPLTRRGEIAYQRRSRQERQERRNRKQMHIVATDERAVG